MLPRGRGCAQACKPFAVPRPPFFVDALGRRVVSSREGESRAVPGVPGMSDRWYVSRGQKKFGPFTAAQMRQLVASGKLKRADAITREGLGRWIRAETVKGLFDNAPPASRGKGAPVNAGFDVVEDEEDAFEV